MNKKHVIAPLALTLTFGLAGCGANNEESADYNRVDTARPIGYYSNEQHDTNGNTNVYTRDDDGPLTEIMDHTYGDEGQDSVRNVRNIGNTREGSRTPQNGSNRNYDSELATQVANSAEKVQNVKDANALVYGDKIVIGLEVENNKNIDQTKEKVRDELHSHLGNKDVSIVTDRGIFSSIEDINDEIKNGEPEKSIVTNIERIFNQLTPNNINR